MLLGVVRVGGQRLGVLLGLGDLASDIFREADLALDHTLRGEHNRCGDCSHQLFGRAGFV